MERRILSERTHAGLEAARARGRVGGRTTVMTRERTEAAQKLRADGVPVTHIAEMSGVGRATVRRALEKVNALHSGLAKGGSQMSRVQELALSFGPGEAAATEVVAAARAGAAASPGYTSADTYDETQRRIETDESQPLNTEGWDGVTVTYVADGLTAEQPGLRLDRRRAPVHGLAQPGHGHLRHPAPLGGDAQPARPEAGPGRRLRHHRLTSPGWSRTTTDPTPTPS